MTQSALSQIIRNLEERIGVRLLNRTTRSVTPTQAGERLFLSVGPKFSAMDADLAELSELREKPLGTVRLTATEYAAAEIVLPALEKVLPKYPDIRVEVIIDYGLTNIVAQQVDAGYHLYYPSRRQPSPAFSCCWRLFDTAANRRQVCCCPFQHAPIPPMCGLRQAHAVSKTAFKPAGLAKISHSGLPDDRKATEILVRDELFCVGSHRIPISLGDLQ